MNPEGQPVYPPSAKELLSGLGVNDEDQQFWNKVSDEMRSIAYRHEIVPMKPLDDSSETQKGL